MLKRLAIFAAALMLAGACAVAQAQQTLTYSNFFPPTHAQSVLAQQWCDEVAKRTDGKLRVQYFPGQTLTKAPQAFEGVTAGLSDIAMGCFSYTRGRFPVMEVVDLPLGYKNGQEATVVINEVYAQLKPKELDGVEVLYLHAHGPGLLFTKDKPVAKLEDMKGLKIRSHGSSARLVQALGGTPVTMAMPESYQALSRGTVDGSVHPTESNLGWKLGEVVAYRTASFPVAYTTGFFVVMNKAKWDALPEDVKATVRQINQEWIAKSAEAWDKADEAGLEYFLSLPGRKDIALDEAESARWVAAAKPVLDEYAKSMDERGFDGKAIVSAAQAALAKQAAK